MLRSINALCEFSAAPQNSLGTMLQITARQNAETSAVGVANSVIDCLRGDAGGPAAAVETVLCAKVFAGSCVRNWVDRLPRGSCEGSVCAVRSMLSFFIYLISLVVGAPLYLVKTYHIRAIVL